MTYERLTSIPLFTGISGDDLVRIMDRVELIDVELLPGETFVTQGDTCQCMAIVRSGTIQRTCHYDYGTFQNARKQTIPLSYQVTELLEAPFIIEPEILFGLELKHKNHWAAHTTCQLTMIGKDDIRQTLMYVPVWRINFMNMLCTNLQRSMKAVLPHTLIDTRQATIDYLLRHCSSNGKSAQFNISLEQLSHQLGVTRTTMTKVLEGLEAEHLIYKEKNQINIPDIKLLCQHI